ncbi:DUF3105 domain-containing protein [Candidatus Nomurabacteria bacterium]|nr:DUF3105 domain-containing protein [Candidatus Nomurabacteria bacterium]
MKTEHKIIGGIALLTLIIIVGGVWFSSKEGAKNQEKLSRDMMGEKMEDEGAGHVGRNETHPAYKSNPPTSGPHWAGVAGPGIKDEIVPDELILHSMEHGAAVVWYREDLEQSEIDKIKEAFISADGKKIMLARKDLDVPVALTSWGYLLKLETVDGVKIKEFIETNNDRAPEKAAI